MQKDTQTVYSLFSISVPSSPHLLSPPVDNHSQWFLVSLLCLFCKSKQIYVYFISPSFFFLIYYLPFFITQKVPFDLSSFVLSPPLNMTLKPFHSFTKVILVLVLFHGCIVLHFGCSIIYQPTSRVQTFGVLIFLIYKQQK